MDKAKTIGLFISTVFMASILGAISGLVWAFILDYQIKSGLRNGWLSGLVVGVLFFLFQKAALSSNRGNLQAKETSFATGSMMTGLFVASIFIAIVVRLVKWIFF
jgi:hypothetical protein